MRKLLCFVLITFLLIGCGSINKSRKVAGISRQSLFTNSKNDSLKLQPTLFWAHYDATQRSSMLYVDANQRVRVLAENPPDAAIQSIIGITAKVKGIDGIGEVEAAYNAQKSIAELGKRTAGVNMLRDALYRLNEMYYATVDENEVTKKLIAKSPEILKISQNNDKNFNVENLKNAFKSFNTFDNATIQTLFKNIIDNAKEISIQEATSETEIAKAESSASIKSSEEKIKRLEIINAALLKLDGKLTKDELNTFLKDYLKN